MIKINAFNKDDFHARNVFIGTWFNAHTKCVTALTLGSFENPIKHVSLNDFLAHLFYIPLASFYKTFNF